MRKYLARIPAKLPRSTEELIRWYERYISPLSLIVGFTLDNIILRRVDQLRSNALLFFYFVVASLCILAFHMIKSGRLRGKVFLAIVPYIPVAIQFAFGGLFSGYLVLYLHSAAYATSWVFVAILAGLLVGNERFRRLYENFAFQGSMLFLALMSFWIFFLPVLTGKIGTIEFLISEAIAVGITFVFIRAFALLAPDVFRVSKWRLRQSIASIFLIFNVLYFTNAIPPLPLALKEAGVYHSVKKIGDVYQVKAEPLLWYQKYLNYNTTYHLAPGERVYVFTAIFAPTNLSTTIIHNWEHYDETTGKWVVINSVAFVISGGRGEGYRGYTILDNTLPGKWRVNVQTGNKLIGRVAFTIEKVAQPVQTNTEDH